MRKLVVGALIVPFALACSPSRTQDFKGEPRKKKEGIMTDVRMALPLPPYGKSMFSKMDIPSGRIDARARP